MSTEAEARVIWEYQPAYVLNLLRTPAYARHERLASRRLVPDPRALEERAIERAAVLDDPTRSFRFVMIEGALRCAIAPPAVLVDQLAHLRAVAAWPQVELGVIAAGRALDTVVGHAFHVYDGRSVTVGLAHSSVQTAVPKEVATYLSLFERLAALATTGPALDDLLVTITQELER